MPCERLTFPDGAHGWICSRGRRRAWCACGAPSDFLCDGPGAFPARTCSARLCAAHALEVGRDRHLCAACAALAGAPPAPAPSAPPVSQDAGVRQAPPAGRLEAYSSRIAYGGPDRLDVTRAGGDALGLTFAPSWAILEPALEARRRAGAAVQASLFDAAGQGAGRQDVAYGAAWRDFREAYLAEMRASFKAHRAAWLELLGRPRVVLVCYCVDGARCHRHLLRAEILPRLGAVDRGELPPTWRP